MAGIAKTDQPEETGDKRVPAFNVMAGQSPDASLKDNASGLMYKISEEDDTAAIRNPIEFNVVDKMHFDASLEKYAKKIEFQTPVNKKTNKFDLCNKYIHLTYKGHHDEPKLVKFLESKMAENEHGIEIKTFSVVNEIGKLKQETGEEYEHCHVAFELNRAPKKRIRDPRFFDYQGVHPHIRKCKHAHFRYVCLEYHTKDGIPFTNVDAESEMTFLDLKEMWQASKKNGTNVNHALLQTMEKKGIPMTKAGPMKTALDLSKPIVERKTQEFPTLRPFQQELMNMLELDYVNDRVIGYIWDQQGAFGKSSFARHLYDTGKAFICTTLSPGNAIEALRAHISERGEPQIVIIDISRASNVSCGAVFNLAERFKDNVMTASKYKSATISLAKTPHVWIFSNASPDITKISLDRIDLRIPSVKGNNYDYSFEGKSAMEYNDTIQEFELQKCNLIGEDYPMCKPVRQRIDIELFHKITEGTLDPNILKSYWDRGFFPRITWSLECRPDSIQGGICTLEELPLTKLEIEEYAESKLREQKDAKERDDKLKQIAMDEALDRFALKWGVERKK